MDDRMAERLGKGETNEWVWGKPVRNPLPSSK